MAENARLEESDGWFRRKAIAHYHEEGTIEIDEDSPVSKSEDEPIEGAYVQAWVWVDVPERGVDFPDRGDGAGGPS